MKQLSLHQKPGFTINSAVGQSNHDPTALGASNTGLLIKTILSPAAMVVAAALGLALNVSAQTINEFPPNAMWVGTQAFQGRGVAVSVSPSVPDEAIVASESGGLFQTTDRGAHWVHLDNLPMFRMRDVKYGPLLPGGGRLVIASGLPDNHTHNQGGIWRSNDSGTTWSKPATSNPGCTTFAGTWAIAFEPGTSNVFVGTDCGLAISRDYGATWTHVSPNPPSSDRRIYGVASPTNGVVDLCGAAGHLRSVDHGNTFGSPTGSPAGAQAHCIAVSPVEPSVLFVAGGIIAPILCPDGLQAPNALYEGDYDSTGTVVTWKQVAPPFCMGTGREPWVATQLSRDGNPDHFDIYFSRGADTYRQTVTRKGGTGPRCSTSGWTLLSVDHSDHNGMDFDPFNHRAEFLVSDGGIERPTDESDPANCGAAWGLLGPARNGYHALQIYDVAGQIVQTPGDEHVDLYIGTQDNRFWASPDAGTNWPYGTGTEGFHIQLPRYVTSHIGERVNFGDAVNGNRTALYHFQGVPDEPWKNVPDLGFDNPTLVSALPSLPRIHAQFREHCLSCPLTLAVTTNAGASWNTAFYIPVAPVRWVQASRPVSGTAASDITLYGAYQRAAPAAGYGLLRITGLHVDGTVSGPKVSFADVLGLGSVAQYNMGSGSWLQPLVWAADPNDPAHLMAADVQAHQMKVSRNGGLTWQPDDALTDLVTGYTPVSGAEFRFDIADSEYIGAPATGSTLQPHVIAFDPYHLGHILVGTEAAGLFRSTDDGTNWTAIPGSRKITGITSVFFIDEFTHGNTYPEALVGTYGRGLWKITFTPPGPPSTFFRLDSGVRAAWRDNCWLRHSGCLNPDDLSAPGACDSCHYEAVVGGQITDIILDQNGQVQGLNISGGRVVASTQDGQPVAPRVPGLVSQVVGTFAGCPECLGLVQQGGVIKGVVLEHLQLRALIAGFGALPGEDAIDQFSPAPAAPGQTPDVTPPTGPYLYLSGTVIVGGQATVRSGDAVSVGGTGFCGQGCTPLNLSVGGRDTGTNVTVDANGNFQASFTVIEPNGAYQVTAAQQTGGGGVLSAAGALVVAGADVEPPPELSISLNGPNLMLFWPVDAQGYVLEWTPSLGDPNSWQPYPGQVTIVADQYVVSSQSSTTQAFFRLHRQ
jgi:photosystem II stability/assembly factor-like uncharacterized protein